MRAAARGMLWAALMFVTGAAVAFALVLTLFATENLPRDPRLRHVRQSFVEGSISFFDFRRDDGINGYYQYNDCLMAMMTMFHRSPWQDTVAPVVIFTDWPEVMRGDDGRQLTECQAARAASASPHPETFARPDAYFPYSRYIFAFRIPFNLLIAVAPISVIRIVYRGVGLLMLLAIAAGHLALRARAMRRGDEGKAQMHLAFAAIGMAFLLFYGLDLFGQSMTHAPADIMLYAALAWLSFAPLAKGVRADLVAALLGGLAFAFELFHGTLPLLLAVMLGSIALRTYGAGRRIDKFAALRMTIAYGGGVVGAVAVKIGCIVALEGWASFRMFVAQLQMRVDGGDYGPTDVALRLAEAAGQIAFGSRLVGLSAIAAGMAALLVSTVRGIRNGGDRPTRDAVILLLLSLAPIVGWFLFFRNHSSIHAAFMVRILVWTIAAGAAAAIITHRPARA